MQCTLLGEQLCSVSYVVQCTIHGPVFHTWCSAPHLVQYTASGAEYRTWCNVPYILQRTVYGVVYSTWYSILYRWQCTAHGYLYRRLYIVQHMYNEWLKCLSYLNFHQCLCPFKFIVCLLSAEISIARYVNTIYLYSETIMLRAAAQAQCLMEKPPRHRIEN